MYAPGNKSLNFIWCKFHLSPSKYAHTPCAFEESPTLSSTLKLLLQATTHEWQLPCFTPL